MIGKSHEVGAATAQRSPLAPLPRNAVAKQGNKAIAQAHKPAHRASGANKDLCLVGAAGSSGADVGTLSPASKENASAGSASVGDHVRRHAGSLLKCLTSRRVEGARALSPREGVLRPQDAPLLREQKGRDGVHKAPQDPYVAQLLRHRFGHHAPRVRAMSTPQGTFYISSTIAHGASGKFRVARHCNGTLFGVKEFRTPESTRFSTRAGKRKTSVTPTGDVAAELQLTRKLAPRVRQYGSLAWRGNLYALMTPLRGDMGETLEGMGDADHGTWGPSLLGLRNVARDLALVHRQGFVHRDIKWNNVLLDEGGQPTLWDFGLARSLGGQSEAHVSSLGGTFFPPETLVRDNQGKYTWQPASDVFCLGTMVCDLFDGLGPNPFQVRWGQGTDGRIAMSSIGGHKDGYLRYSRWYNHVFDTLDTSSNGFCQLQENILCAEEQFGDVGLFFASMLRRNAVLTVFSLTALLSPNPRDRFDAEQVRCIFDDLLAPYDEALASDMLRNEPRSEAMQRAIDAVTMVHRHYHPGVEQRLAA